MLFLQGEAAERGRATALQAQVLQQAGELASVRAQLEDAQRQRQGAAPPQKVRAPLLCMAILFSGFGV